MTILFHDLKTQDFALSLSVLDVNAFERLLGPCMEIMKRNIDDYEDQLVRIFGSKAHISDIRWKQQPWVSNFSAAYYPNNNHTPPLNEQQEQIVADKLSNDNLPMSYKIIPYDDI